MPRPTVNLDPIGQWLDRLLEGPAGKAGAVLAPDLHARVVELREHLPEVAAELEARAVDAARAEIMRETGALTRGLARGLDRFLRQARAGGGKPQPKRLAAGKKRKPPRP